MNLVLESCWLSDDLSHLFYFPSALGRVSVVTTATITSNNSNRSSHTQRGLCAIHYVKNSTQIRPTSFSLQSDEVDFVIISDF